MRYPAYQILLFIVGCSAVTAYSSESVVLEDIGEFEPASAITSEKTTGTWQRAEVGASPSGWILQTDAEVNAPDISVAIPVQGTYDIYIGVYMPDSLVSGVLVRMDDDPHFAFVRGCCDGKYPAFHETYYKCQDCTGRHLVFRQPAESRSYVTHVRLVPRSTPPKMPRATREVIGLADAWHYNYFFSSRESDSISTLVKMHELCGLTEISFEAGRSCMWYETSVGTRCRIDPNRPRTKWLPYHCDRHRPFSTAIETAHALGLDFESRLCMNIHYAGTYRGSITSDFAVENSKFQERRKDGTAYPQQLCFGYDEVRAERVAVLREQVELGASSLCLDCMKYPPMARWGKPYVDGFKDSHGIDPSELSADDPHWQLWLMYRASYFTRLVREVRSMLSEVRKPDIPLSIRVDDRGVESALESGINMRELVSGGLVQKVILGGDSPDRVIAESVIQEYRQILDGTSVKLIAGLQAHGFPAMPGPEHHKDGAWPAAMYFEPNMVALAHNIDHMYDLGVDGVAFYESDEGTLYPNMRDLFIAARTPETMKELVRNIASRDSKEQWGEVP